MKIRKTLKRFVIDNLLAAIISLTLMISMAFFLAYNILEGLKSLWFGLLFIGFAVFMYNICIMLNMGDFSKHLKRDMKELMKKDNKTN